MTKITVMCAEKGYFGIPGKMTVCCECAMEVFLSDSTYDAAHKELGDAPFEIRPYCFECFQKLNPKNLASIPLTEKQQKEVNDALVRLGLKKRT